MKDRRRERRDACGVRVEYALHNADCSVIDCGPWSNLTFDISYSGMSIYSDKPLSVGQKLKIFLRHLSNDPIVAEVTWCSRISDNLFKMGIKYR